MSWFNWIPAFAGMTASNRRKKRGLMQKLLSDEQKKHVIPAKAGIHRRHAIPAKTGIYRRQVIPAKAGIHRKHVIPAKAGIHRRQVIPVFAGMTASR